MQGRANYLKEDDSVLLLARNGDDAYTTSKNLWCLDSAASYHMCGYKEIFMELSEKMNEEVSFGDASKAQASGVGKILIKFKDGRQQYLSDAYYVPKMKTNILSLGEKLRHTNEEWEYVFEKAK